MPHCIVSKSIKKCWMNARFYTINLNSLKSKIIAVHCIFKGRKTKIIRNGNEI